MKAICVNVDGLPKGELVLGSQYFIEKQWVEDGFEKVRVSGQNPNAWYFSYRFEIIVD